VSEHASIKQLTFNASARTVPVKWSNFLAPQKSATQRYNAIDEFYVTHRGLNVLGALAAGEALEGDLRLLLADQILLGYVSATEQFLRRLMASTVRLCPHTRARAASQQISFSAIDYYHSQDIEHALTERVSFSEPGKVSNALGQRLGVKVPPSSSLERAIDEFEQLCQLRHALVHSRGVVNSSNAQGFDLPSLKSQYAVNAGAAELQSAAGICLNLVREANEATAKSVLWCWLREGTLTGRKIKDKPRLTKFLETYSSRSDETDGVDSPKLDDLIATCVSILDDLAQKSA
jgi:hypothetical protein